MISSYGKNIRMSREYLSHQHIFFTWYLLLFWDTTCRALTCTAFTAFFEESTNPLVNVPNKLVGDVDVPSTCSSVGDVGDLGDRRIPSPPVKRAKVDLGAFPDDCSSWDPVNGCGIFKFLAHDEMPEVEIFEGASSVDWTGADSTAVDLAALDVVTGCEFDTSADPESIILGQISSLQWQNISKHGLEYLTA